MYEWLKRRLAKADSLLLDVYLKQDEGTYIHVSVLGCDMLGLAIEWDDRDDNPVLIPWSSISSVSVIEE